nr:reverse transcriptase domain-containing protein [Tanacetum cinerariifolium]
SSSKLCRDQASNPTSSMNPTPKGRIRRSSKQKVENSHFEEHLISVATMTDNRTMAEMLRAPTEGCAEVILVLPILAKQFELKHSLINMMTSEQLFGLEKDNPHDHIRWFNKITSTIKYNDVPNSMIKLILFSFSLAGAARRWLKKEPPRSITTWDDLVSKFINEFFPPSRTTNLRNEISNFQQKFDESFHEAWERYEDPITFSSNSLLEEFTDELALITYPPDYDDNLKCDIESDLREIEFLFYQGEDSDLKDSIDQTDLANRDDLFVDPTPEMFTDKHAPDYSFSPRFDVYPDDDFLEIESDADNFYDDSFDSNGEKIKESELLIDQLDLPCDIIPYSEYDSFNSQDFSKDDDFPSPDNEDKVFNPGILICEKSVKIITHVAQGKKLAISYASLVFEEFDPLFYELLVFKDVPNSMRLLLFSSKNEHKFFKPGIYTSEKVHFCFLLELSHP